MPDELLSAVTHALAEELNAAFGRVAHCVGQLTDEQLWWRPRPDMNAIGNLVLHLAGNVQQMIVGSVGGAPDTRDRPAEFAARGPVSSDELLGKLLTAVRKAK